MAENRWYIFAEKHWYTVAEKGWHTIAENRWYTCGRKLTVSALGASLDAAEQELVQGAVNILTMHKAKGLSADVVFIVGAEDEFIPGRNEGAREGDERRLLFVSMTRARHRLYISYCRERVGRQAHLGRNSGRHGRTLTRFLRDAPIRVEDGTAFVLDAVGLS